MESLRSLLFCKGTVTVALMSLGFCSKVVISFLYLFGIITIRKGISFKRSADDGIWCFSSAIIKRAWRPAFSLYLLLILSMLSALDSLSLYSCMYGVECGGDSPSGTRGHHGKIAGLSQGQQVWLLIVSCFPRAFDRKTVSVNNSYMD